MMSEFVFFEYFVDEIVILKNLWIGLNSKSDIKKIVVYFDFCYTGELVLLKNYIYCLRVVSGVSVVDYKWGKILRRMVVVCLIFGRAVC